MRPATLLALLIGSVTAGASHAAITSVDLGNYELTATIPLALTTSPQAYEASAVTWNADNGYLYVIEDEGNRVYEINRQTGAVVSSMTLQGFAGSANSRGDTEGITWLGGSDFAFVEERIQSLYRFTYVPGGTLVRDAAQVVDLGPDVGNIGLEGLSYDPLTGKILVVKEKAPDWRVGVADVNFATHTGIVSTLFDPSGLGLLDVADIQTLSGVASLQAGADGANLLVLSQESGKLLEVDRTGAVLGMFDLAAAGISGSTEGVTIDADGRIYLVSEDPYLYVLAPKPVPVPAAVWLLCSGLGALGAAARRRKVA